MTNEKLLKSKMALHGDDDFVNSLAELLNIRRQTASAKLNSESDFNQTEIAIIAKHYDLNGNDIKEIFTGGDNFESE